MRAVICGAGIAGLALAHQLQASAWEVTVVEKAPGPREQGYMIDFFGPGYEAADRMGLLPRLRELGNHVVEFGYLDEMGRRRASIDYQRFEKAASGDIVSILRPDLELTLRESVNGKVDLRYSTSISNIANSADSVTVTLTDGTDIVADLLVGADGIHSTVREMVFGPQSQFIRYLGMHTGAYIFDDPEIYAAVKDRFLMTDTIDKQMGFYGVRDGRVAVFTVHRDPDPQLPSDLQSAIRDTYATLGWYAPQALRKCPQSQDVYYDQVAQIEMSQWSRGRVTLLGDSAFAVSLLAGQGASLGIAGAYVLAKQLETADTVEAALAGYQQYWWPVATRRQKTGRRGAQWFLPASSAQLRLRRIAMNAMRLPVLDRYLGTALIGKSHENIDELGTATVHAAQQ